MTKKGLFIWVEGPDDQRFFEVVIKPILDIAFRFVAVRPYAEKKTTEINKFLKAAPHLHADYVFVADNDHSPCVTRRKQELVRTYPSLDPARIIVVVKEIECWYLAGLDDPACKALKIKPLKDTNDLTKEAFDRLMHARYDSRVAWMAEMLENYSIPHARTKNQSFAYFAGKAKL